MYRATGFWSFGSAKSRHRPMSETVRPAMMMGARLPIRSEMRLVRNVITHAAPYLPSEASSTTTGRMPRTYSGTVISWAVSALYPS